jgi:hypothetical protein
MSRVAFGVPFRRVAVMAEPVDFPGATRTLLAPAPGYPTTRVFATETLTVSCWQLTPAERDEIDRNGRIWIAVLQGDGTQPPMRVGTEAEIRSIAADYGAVWNSEDSQ